MILRVESFLFEDSWQAFAYAAGAIYGGFPKLCRVNFWGIRRIRIIVYWGLCRVPYFGNLKETELGFRAWGLGFRARNLQRLEVCTFKVCNPRFWVPNTQIKNHIPWLKDPNPKKGTKPKSTKDNSLN